MNTDARRPLAYAAGKAAALLLALVIALVLATVQAPAKAMALETASSDTVVDSDTWGTVTWTLYDDGALVISPTDGSEGTLGSHSNASGLPWYLFRTEITSVTFTGTIHAGESAVALFRGCSSLESIDLSCLDTSSVTDMSEMFSSCSSLTSLDLSCLDTSSVTDMSEMFSNCSSLTSLNLSGWDTSSVTDMSVMFYNCSSLTSLDLSAFDTSSAVDMPDMFCGCSSLVSLDLSNFDTSDVTDMASMFYGCSSLTSLNLSGFDTSNVTSMQYLFRDCSSLASLDLTGFDTSSVENMASMFYGCSSLTSLDLTGFDTSNVAYMTYLFYGCSSLTSLDLSGFDTSSVRDMTSMFSYCNSLTSLDLSSFDTSSVTDMSYMFINCSSLTSLDLSSFDTSSVTDMTGMFRGCSSLTILDLSSFDTSSVTDTSYQFYRCTNLVTIYVSSDWGENVRTSDSWGMFEDCTSLVGGNGTAYSSSHTTISYACIDTDDTPGYFTYRAAGSSDSAAATVVRLAGDNRYETAAAVAAEYGTSDYVIVAAGKNEKDTAYADALAASYAAGVLDCSVVLTKPDALPEATAEAIVSSGASHVIIVGGTAAVSEEVAEAIAALDGVEDVTRIAGETRYETAVLIYEEFSSGASGTAILATGQDFADALSASPLSYAAGWPILLTKSDSLPAATLEALADFGNVIIVGGTSAVSQEIEDELEAMGITVTRIKGENRYETAVKIAEYAIGEGILSADVVGIATGTDYPDALAGGSYLGLRGGVLLLAKEDSLSGDRNAANLAAFLEEYDVEVDEVYLLGGESTVSASLEEELAAVLG